MREFLSRIVDVGLSLGAGKRLDREVCGRDEERELLESLEKAREHWLVACNTFETVAERDLVDAAIYTLDAAERRYMYLWRLAKEKGLVAAEMSDEGMRGAHGGQEGFRRRARPV